MVGMKLGEVGRGGRLLIMGTFKIYYLPNNEFKNCAILHTSSGSKDLK